MRTDTCYASGGYNEKAENANWYFAVGHYSAWSKRRVKSCKRGSYTLRFEYSFYDRYNWDAGKKTPIAGVMVDNALLGELHRQGLAQEFDMRASVKKTISWTTGSNDPKIVDG